MVSREQTKADKAKQLRYKKPIVKNLNLDTITQDLWDIQEACEDVHWFTDSEDGEETLVNALCGDEDEAYEFKMVFADLCAECERMVEDLHEEWVPDCFDIFFVSAGAGETYGGLLGFDEWEQDYFGIGGMDSYAERWATMLEHLIESSTSDPMKVIVENADRLSHEADVEGITGFMYGCAIGILSQCWEYGEELRKWHNKEYGYDGDGVVNPAIMSISK